MTPKKLFFAWLIMLVVCAGQLSAQKSAPSAEKTGQPIQIAPQVAAIMDADVALRKSRTDIPMTYLRTLHLPAQQNQVYPVFMFQMKNADLNFAAPAETPDILKASHYAFSRVYRLENGVAAGIVKERFIRFDLEEKAPGFRPDALNYYSIAGDIFPPGSYLLALAVATPDFTRISNLFAEFTLPDVAAIKDKLVTTPVLSMASLQVLPVAETRLAIHKNSFVFNTLLLGPVLNNEFKAGESLDLFYFILGCKPDSATGTLNLQVTYTFKKDGKEINKLAPQALQSNIISQPIALTFTEITRNEKGVEMERKEKLLEPGDYILEIGMLDNVSKATGLQEFKFKIIP